MVVRYGSVGERDEEIGNHEDDASEEGITLWYDYKSISLGEEIKS